MDLRQPQIAETFDEKSLYLTLVVDNRCRLGQAPMPPNIVVGISLIADVLTIIHLSIDRLSLLLSSFQTQH